MISATVQQTMRQYKHFPPGASLIVGVAGGADSLALMHILLQLRSGEGFSLHIATLDHSLRGESGAADAAYVEALAQAWGLPVTRGRVDVPAYAAETGQGIEAAARQLRYAFLARVAAEQSATHIAVAHHADDQAETILLHMLRGAGLEGLQGMAYEAPVPGHPHLRLLRPLLGVARVQIEAYCAANQLQPRQDASNSDLSHRRNLLRHELLPRMQQINPQLRSALLRLSQLAQQDTQFIDAAYARDVQPFIVHGPQHSEYPLARWRDLHPALQSRLLLREARRMAPEVETGSEAIQAALSLLQAGHTGQIAILSGAMQARLAYDVIMLEPLGADPVLPQTQTMPLQIRLSEPVKLAVPGSTRLSDSWVLHVRPAPAPGYCFVHEPGAEWSVRNRLPGDRFAPPGLHGRTQKLKKYLIDRKVPHLLREALPLLMLNQSVVAIIDFDAWTLSSSHKISHSSENSFCFLLEHLNEV